MSDAPLLADPAPDAGRRPPAHAVDAWDGPPVACCGPACSLSGWGALCLAGCVPCAGPVLYGITRRRLLGTSASLAAASYIALLWLPPAAALALAWRRDAVCLPVDLDARGVTDAQRAACAAAGAASLAAWAVAFSSFLVFAALAARGRARARARHGLSGSAVEDCALWACCCPLVLAQEARTAAKADMERGGRG